MSKHFNIMCIGQCKDKDFFMERCLRKVYEMNKYLQLWHA